MWDPERKVGVLNDFDLAKCTTQKGGSGKENTGTLPFVALDLVSPEGRRGEIPRLYRHDAESFFWSLAYLCLSAVKGENGKNHTITQDLLRNWFKDPETCLYTKLGFKWKRYHMLNAKYAYPNARILVKSLRGYWLGRYRRQDEEPTKIVAPSLFRQKVGFPVEDPSEPPPYVEEDEDIVFLKILILQDEALMVYEGLKETRGALDKMFGGYMGIDWSD